MQLIDEPTYHQCWKYRMKWNGCPEKNVMDLNCFLPMATHCGFGKLWPRVATPLSPNGKVARFHPSDSKLDYFRHNSEPAKMAIWVEFSSSSHFLSKSRPNLNRQFLGKKRNSPKWIFCGKFVRMTKFLRNNFCPDFKHNKNGFVSYYITFTYMVSFSAPVRQTILNRSHM
jgi:hypothetical protein